MIIFAKITTTQKHIMQVARVKNFTNKLYITEQDPINIIIKIWELDDRYIKKDK